MMNNGFYLILKAFFVLKIFKFLSWLFGYAEQWNDEKDKINFKIYDVTTWEKTTAMHALTTNISWSKGK